MEEKEKAEKKLCNPLQTITFPTGKKEILFAGGILLCAMALCNFVLFGGFNLGFSIAAVACIICSCGYLLAAGCKPTAYSLTLLILSVLICAGFARSDDGFVKFVLTGFVLVSVNLALCLIAGQNLHKPGKVSSLLDAPRAIFYMGFGKLPESCRGLSNAFRRSGSLGQKGSAFLLGLCITIPVLALVIPLLISADAAFDGLMKLLPDFDFAEIFATILFGCLLAGILYTRGVGLRHSEKEEKAAKSCKGISSITVNTVLVAVCVVYLAYLVSQLSYLFGGFAGILPENYTLAEYARRGFFEMAVLSGINLAIITLSLGLVKKEQKEPLPTRLLCLFIGLVTLFLVVTASAKMFLYIGSYGLTRLRVLTQVIMLYIGLVTLVVMIRLFVRKLPYMQAVVILALVLGGSVLWADVDTQVARYNVGAYLSDQLETVDVSHLQQLGNGATSSIAKLAQRAPSAEIASQARTALDNRELDEKEDFREWNYVNHKASAYLSTDQNE